MKIVYRIINKDNDEDDCLYELKHDSIYYWGFIKKIKYVEERDEYPILYLTDSRNLNDDYDKAELAGALRFEPGDLYEHHS